MGEVRRSSASTGTSTWEWNSNCGAKWGGAVILSTPQLLHPAVYAEGRRITVIATVTGQEERKIGELPYRYPVISAVDLRLWPKEIAVAPYPAPWAYSYYPWPYTYWRYRGWGPWPFWW